MITVSLIAPPNQLDPTLANTVRDAWGGSELRWLCAGEAAEFDLPELPDNFWQVWKDLQTLGTDLIAQPGDGRKKRVLLADMDSTMIAQECIDELAAEAGIGAQVAGITAQAMNGEIDFEDALRARVSLLKGLKSTVIDTVLSNRITLVSGGRTLVQTMKAHGAYAALVSGGFTDFTVWVADKLGFDESRANVLLHADGCLTGGVADPILGRAAKIDALHDITSRLGFEAADVLAVGDGANDLGMLGVAGSGVAAHAKPSVAAQCDIRINHCDLTALLYLQGYRKTEFSG